MELTLSSPVDSLFRGKSKAAQELKDRGINTVEDLLYFIPRKYLDRSKIAKISEAKQGDYVTCIGTIKSIETRKTGKKIKITTAVIFDGTGYLYLVWFGERHLEKILKPETTLAVSGTLGTYMNRLQMENPDFDILENQELDELSSTGRIVSVYPALQSLSIKRLRKIIRSVFDKCVIDEILPAEIVLNEKLLPRAAALYEIHFPSGMKSLEKALERLRFEEIFLLQTALADLKAKYRNPEKGIAVKGDFEKVEKFLEILNVSLTDSQKKAIDEIIKDISSKEPMNRLLHGEVGSGKTIVALAAAVYTISGGYQAAFMAPTEVLAIQQFTKYGDALSKTGVRCGVMVASLKQSEKKKIIEQLEKGELDLIFGTHALIYDNVRFKNLGLVIIDEQHRFGTMQRLLLKKKGENPDILTVSATPIPRTLALTVFGDLDITSLKERPQGKSIEEQVQTIHLSYSERDRAYKMLAEEIEKGGRGFIVVPLVEESTEIEAKSLSEVVSYLKNFVPENLYGVLYGKLESKEKYSSVEKFKNGEIKVLVATTVVEVGIDVPEATFMIIENAERFGLSQLHQLRGRVGRGAEKGTVIVLSDFPTEESRIRIETFVKVKDGFKLAEEDLKIRGEGEIFGIRQTGPSDLKFVKYISDIELIEKARKLAFDYYQKFNNKSVSVKILTEEAYKKFKNLEYLESG